MNDSNLDRGSVNPTRTGDDLNDLRWLLLSPEQADLEKLKQRLDDPRVRAKELSHVLAEAIVIRASQDKKLAQALLPTIEETIRDSVRRDPRFLADAIFPVIGPAIRKAIAESIRSMIQSTNETLSYALSWRGLKWRWESIQTGRPFAEIVMLHTLLYRVEQVFLLHRETGLVLQHVAIPSAMVKDADMVSGMLTAIQDYVHDSFGVESNQLLNSLNVGEFIIWIEQHTELVLAAVIHGNPPEAFRGKLRETLEKIDFEQSQSLLAFNGDISPFETSRHHLEECLVQAKQDNKKPGADSRPTIPPPQKTTAKKDEPGLLWLIVGAGLVCFLILAAAIIFSL